LVGSGICDGGDCPYSREQDESVLHYGFMEDNTLLRRAEQVIHQSETTSRRWSSASAMLGGRGWRTQS